MVSLYSSLFSTFPISDPSIFFTHAFISISRYRVKIAPSKLSRYIRGEVFNDKTFAYFAINLYLVGIHCVVCTTIWNIYLYFDYNRKHVSRITSRTAYVLPN